MGDSDKDKRTIWCGNLAKDVTEELLFELFLQAGPLESVRIPKDKESGQNRPFGFVTFRDDVSVPYTLDLFSGISLEGRMLRLQSRGGGGQQSGSNSPICGQPQRNDIRLPYRDDDHGGQGLHRSSSCPADLVGSLLGNYPGQYASQFVERNVQTQQQLQRHDSSQRGQDPHWRHPDDRASSRNGGSASARSSASRQGNVHNQDGGGRNPGGYHGRRAEDDVITQQRAMLETLTQQLRETPAAMIQDRRRAPNDGGRQQTGRSHGHYGHNNEGQQYSSREGGHHSRTGGRHYGDRREERPYSREQRGDLTQSNQYK
ncbi:PREDICTED: RNA-binding protein 7-like [Priapulus caudatus]|uniref:RNA-binding protein 7-like n=1 Tax=Priapulus caudatus TaxID=37621 RepID=A0ABM1E338_PRICU|nr:PREDICTED: RNA-binding protein 7-like [Priapulus caudatus]